MSTPAVFILGLLVGWLVEWIIDWVYWRKRRADLQAELDECKRHLANREAEDMLSANRMAAIAVPTPDDLIVIKGIGPVIARKLNQAGIYTFQDLAALKKERLREIVGDMIQRLADEDDIIQQARELAAKKDRGG